MKFLPLLGQTLKSDRVIEILECFSLEVIYDFDRLHEGTEDRYWCSAPAQGFEFRCDQTQRIDVIFLYVASRGKFAAIDVASIDIPCFANIDQARAEFERAGLQFKIGSEYIKVLSGNHWTHYEFRGSLLSLITVSLATA